MHNSAAHQLPGHHKSVPGKEFLLKSQHKHTFQKEAFMASLTCNFLSYTLRRAVDLTVVIPSMCFSEMMEKNPHHKQGARYPVLYLLHGYGNNHRTWNGYTCAELFAEERNMAVVMFSAENKAYINHGGDDNYYDFISRELPEFVEAMFPVSAAPKDTYIAGLSMGGYGALVHGLSQAERFAAIGSFSGAARARENAPEIYDPYKIAVAHAKEGRNTPIYLSCGDKDFLYEDNVRFREHLSKLGYDVTWVVGEGYTHEWRYWNRELEAFLDWIPRTDEYRPAGSNRKI